MKWCAVQQPPRLETAEAYIFGSDRWEFSVPKGLVRQMDGEWQIARSYVREQKLWGHLVALMVREHG